MEEGSGEDGDDGKYENEMDEDGVSAAMLWRDLDEFMEMKRKLISEAERREGIVLELTREKEGLRRQRDSRAAELELIQEKDQQIAMALKEGEKLSIRLMEVEGKNRQLKKELGGRAGALSGIKSSLATTREALDALTARAKALEISERSSVEARDAAERRLRELTVNSRSKLEASASLEAARAELDRLKKKQNQAMEHQALTLRSEAQARMETFKDQWSAKRDALMRMLQGLKERIDQVESTQRRMDDGLVREQKDLKDRCQTLEHRNLELVAAVPDATRPLLRQIEALQAALVEQERAESVVDSSLQERIREAEGHLAAASERDQATRGRLAKLDDEVAFLKEVLRSEKDEMDAIARRVEEITARRKETEIHYHGAEEATRIEIEKLRTRLSRANQDIKGNQSSVLDDIAQFERTEQALRHECQKLEQDIALKEGRIASIRENRQEASVRSGGSLMGPAMSDTSTEVLRQGIFSMRVIETTMKWRSEEADAVKLQIERKEEMIKKLATQVLGLTNRLQELDNRNVHNPAQAEQLENLRTRHAALEVLVMERDQKVSELEHDLQDMKIMYKEQINSLLLQIESRRVLSQ